MPLKGLHCQVPELANSDACPRPTTHLEGVRRPGVGPTLPAAHLRALDGIADATLMIVFAVYVYLERRGRNQNL